MKKDCYDIPASDPIRKPRIVSFWDGVWFPYLDSSSFTEKKVALLEGLDDDSREYVEKTLFIYDCIRNSRTDVDYQQIWTELDLLNQQGYADYISSVMNVIDAKYYTDKKFGNYLFFSRSGLWGMKFDLKGKDILDLGAYTGDSACMFLENYQDFNKIIAYEPDEPNYKSLVNFVTENDLAAKVVPFQKGLGNKREYLRIKKEKEFFDGGATFNTQRESFSEYGGKIEISTIDAEVEEHGFEVGLIKMDIEGFEKLAIEGGHETIIRNKPVLVISLYHTPQDFFEIKPYLESMGVGYKYKIRRGGNRIPLGDIVLIAYCDESNE